MKYIIQETEGNDCIVGPTIDQYLVANCLYMIDEFNMLYKGWNKPELKIEADEKFNEMDITVRLGYPFKQNAHYTFDFAKLAIIFRRSGTFAVFFIITEKKSLKHVYLHMT